MMLLITITLSILVFGFVLSNFHYVAKLKQRNDQLKREQENRGYAVLIAKSFYENRNGLVKDLIQDFLKSDLSLLRSQLELLHQAYKQDNPDSKVICYYYIGTLKDLSIQLNDKLSNRGLDGEEWRLIHLK